MPRSAPTSGIVTPYLRSRPFLDGLNLYEFFVQQEIVEDFQRPGEEEGHVIQDVRANMNATNRGLT
jgi:hypothetical protein